MSYLAYFNGEGRVLLVKEGTSPMAPPPSTVHEAAVPDGTTANQIYFDVEAGEVRWKALFEVVAERNRLSGIPPGTTAIILGEIEIVDDGEIEFEADVEEKLIVALDHPHYLFARVEVETGP